MDVGIPDAVLTHGGIYFWKGDRDVPDQWNVVFDYPAVATAGFPILGANDRISLGVVGLGGRGTDHLNGARTRGSAGMYKMTEAHVACTATCCVR
jgi:hypothetical protein